MTPDDTRVSTVGDCRCRGSVPTRRRSNAEVSQPAGDLKSPALFSAFATARRTKGRVAQAWHAWCKPGRSNRDERSFHMHGAPLRPAALRRATPRDATAMFTVREGHEGPSACPTRGE